MKNLYLIGGGGHCKSCIDVIESTQEYEIKGIFDAESKVGESILGYKVLDTDRNILRYNNHENFFLITVGQIKTSKLRENLFSLNLNFAKIISPRAYVATTAKIEKGTIVMHDALVNSNAKVGKNCIINTKSLIEHDCVIEDHCHISTGAIVNGSCHIESNGFVGSNAVVKQGIRVMRNSIIPFGETYE